MLGREARSIRERVAHESGTAALLGGGDLEALRQEAEALAAPGFWTWDLVVVLEDTAAPAAVDPTQNTFRGGAARGRAYAYDYAQQRIVCAGDFVARNASKVEYTSQGLGLDHGAAAFAVRNDLEAQALRAARQALQAVE
jgi:hypothetical protein